LIGFSWWFWHCVLYIFVFDLYRFFQSMIDAHTHLSDEWLYADWRGCVDRFVWVGGTKLMTVSLDNVSFERNIEIVSCAEDEDIPCLIKTTLGYHPWEIISGTLWSETILEKFDYFAQQYWNYEHQILALWECGIDLHYPWAVETLRDQQLLFAGHCQFALELGLPVVVHSRDWFAETMAVVKDYPDVSYYFHCRWYGKDELLSVFDALENVFIGFCGNITYKNAHILREALENVPLDCLLLETDAPYLASQKLRWKKNEPSFLIHSYEYVSHLLWIPLDDLYDQIDANFVELCQL